MSLKRFGTILVAMLALGAVLASSAFAAAETKPSVWRINGAKAVEGLTCASGEHEGSPNLFLKSEIGTTPVELKATGIECIGAELKQVGTSAQATGKLNFTGVTFVTPSTCKVTAAGSTSPAVTSIETNALTAEVYMEGTKSYVKFTPTTGTTFAKFGIGTCALATENIAVTGSVFGLSPNATGVEEVSQPLTFSKEIEETASGVSGGELKLGTKSAFLTGRVVNKVASGLKFGANES